MKHLDNIEELARFAEHLADVSGKIIRKYFRELKSTETKADMSPVTIADLEAERAMRDIIEAEQPFHGIIGEELGVTKPDAEIKWILDPVDGTKSFMIGRPIFGTLIGLIYKEKPVIGIIDQPVIRDRWLGISGQGTTLNTKTSQVRHCSELRQAILCTTGPEYFNRKELTLFNHIAKKAKYTVYGGDCYNYGLLASGHVDIVIEANLKPHDFYPLAAVIEAAGGLCTDWQGRPLNFSSEGQVLAAGDKFIHEKVLEMLNG